MRRRLDLALALVHRPRVLFLDEPTTGLDPTSRGALWREVRALNDEGTTVFLTTQYLEEAEQLADRVGIIAAGRLVAEGTPDGAEGARRASRRCTSSCADAGGRGRRARGARPARRRGAARDPATPTRVALRAAGRQGRDRAGDPRARRADVEVESVEVETPTLDDVFAAVTGSYLEGAADAAATSR